MNGWLGFSDLHFKYRATSQIRYTDKERNSFLHLRLNIVADSRMLYLVLVFRPLEPYGQNFESWP